jgi:AbrB family looped-hinge helix DNA binding protein
MISRTARVSEKGQVTIPKQLRDRLGIRAGQILEFKEERGRLVATKTSSDDPIDRVYGILKTDTSTDEFIEELRGRPDAI